MGSNQGACFKGKVQKYGLLSIGKESELASGLHDHFIDSETAEDQELSNGLQLRKLTDMYR